MQDYREYADELIDQIEAGELDPAEVDIRPFIEDDETVLTPELAEYLPSEKIEEHNARVQDRDHRALREEVAEQDRDAERAREALLEAGRQTTTVTLGEVDGDPVAVEVRTEVPGRLERRMRDLPTDPEAVDDIEAVLDPYCDLLATMCEEAGFDSPGVWREVWEERGSPYLLACVETVLDVADEYDEAVGSFRDE